MEGLKVFCLFLAIFSVNATFPVPIGGICKDDLECVGALSVTPGEPRSECVQKAGDLDKLCYCLDGYLTKPDFMDCLPIRDDIGEACEISAQCENGKLGEYSECESSKCACIEDAVKVDLSDECLLKNFELFEKCLADEQCSPHLGIFAFCSSKSICDCDKSLSVPKPDKTECLELTHTIGGSCEDSLQCQFGTPGELSYCFDSKCECLPEAVPSLNNKCLPKVGYEDDCDESPQCTDKLGSHGECTMGKCVCDVNSVINEKNNFCLEIINEVGGECLENQQCRLGTPSWLSECRGRKCACMAEAVPVGNTCLLRAGYQETCVDTVQCTGILGPLSECVSRKCDCLKDKSLISETNDFCLPIIKEVGGYCEEDQQCQLGDPDYSECINSRCACKSNAVPTPPGYRCLPKAGYYKECELSLQCLDVLGPRSECVSNHCDCDETAVISESEDFCLPIINEIKGTFCEESNQCIVGKPGPNSHCLSNTCQCTSDALELPSFHTCFKKATKIGDFCEHIEQCQFNLGDLTECSEVSKCKCTLGAVEVNGRCFIGSIPIGDECQFDEQCSGTSKCSPANRCTCEPGVSIPSEDLMTCLNIINYLGEICMESNQCILGRPGQYSLCEKDDGNSLFKICKCSPASVPIHRENKCFKRAEFVGDVCQFDEQCSANLDTSNCINGLCKCDDASVPSTPNDKCIPKRKLSESCTDNNQCSYIPYSTSCLPIDPTDPRLGSICKCDPGYDSLATQTCFKMANFIGDSCAEHNNQCDWLPEATCQSVDSLEKSCQCNYSTHVKSQDEMSCLPIVPELGGSCRENAQCIKNNVDCIQTQDGNQCLCRPGDYVESNVNVGECVQIIRGINLPCSEQIQCTSGLGSQAICDFGLCRCNFNSGYYLGQCHVKRGLGSPCYLAEECHVGVNNNTFCNYMNVCACIPGMIEAFDSCYVRKRIGDNCENDRECVAISGEVFCDYLSQECACKFGYKPDIDNNVCVSSQSPLEPIGMLLLIKLFLIFCVN